MRVALGAGLSLMVALAHAAPTPKTVAAETYPARPIRMVLLPDVPPLAEAALPGFKYDGWFGIWAPGKTPRKTINAISQEVARILALPDVGERIVSQGAAPRSGAPVELDKLVRSEVETRAKVLKASGAGGS
ncbi:MAG: tripartite tricarboxylate transporter substrate-binding protein [Betaproteobacteria bacterium]